MSTATGGYRTSFGLAREDAWRARMNAARNALAIREVTTRAATVNGVTRLEAMQDAQKAYDLAIAAAQQDYESTTEAAWNAYDTEVA